MPNSFDTHMLVEFSKERNLQNQVMENLFYSFFVDGKNIGNKDMVLMVYVSETFDPSNPDTFYKKILE